jgi:hypothetical protein
MYKHFYSVFVRLGVVDFMFYTQKAYQIPKALFAMAQSL